MQSPALFQHLFALFLKNRTHARIALILSRIGPVSTYIYIYISI